MDVIYYHGDTTAGLIHPIFEGLAFGLLFVFSMGPGFFLLLHTSLRHGAKSASFLVLGISSSDIVIVSLVLIGFSSILENTDVRFVFGCLGALMLGGYGIYMLGTKAQTSTEVKPLSASGMMQFWLKGVFINGLNPNVFVFWIGIVSTVSVRYHNVMTDKIYFFIGTLTTLLCLDLLKARFAPKLKHILTERMVLVLNRAVGVVMLAFGISLGIYVFNFM